MPENKIRVLVVDDSASVRQALTSVLESDPEIEVMATASDPYVAARHIMQEVPDVITLDMEMPRMDGLTFLRKVMSQHPLPVVMCSRYMQAGSEARQAALEAGAVDTIMKPNFGASEHLSREALNICNTIKNAASIDPRRRTFQTRSSAVPANEPKLSADVILPYARIGPTSQILDMVVCIGASTGGTEALARVLQALPEETPGILVVQHMPKGFTGAFARRLNSLCAMEVREAEDGDQVRQGLVLIAPGDRHMLLERRGSRYFVALRDGPPVARHRPSVDVLFRSAAQAAGANVMGIVMTGMGDDGARGMFELHETGAFTIVQDEASCIVYGMPKEAIAQGGVDRVIPLNKIAEEIIEEYGRR